MTIGAASGSGLVNGAALLVARELGGGAEAMATELLEVAVVPGSELLLIAEANQPAGATMLVVWGEPAFLGAAGERSLLELSWEPVAALPGEVAAFRAHAGRELLLGGRPCDAALLTTGAAGLRVRVPPGSERLVVECGFDGAALPGPSARVRCSVYRATPA
jgi:hypothetical protein